MKIEVYGVPVPQGSKRVVRGHLIDVNHKSLRSWRNLVAFAAQGDGVHVLTGPVMVDVRFYFSRPKHHYGTGRNEAKLKPTAQSHPKGRPDLDKLVRAVLDALTGVAFTDDSQVTTLFASKRWADERDPGASIEVKNF